MMKGLMAVNNHYPFELVPLPYAYDALEPYIDAETMALHHDKHLRTYVDNLNTVLSGCPPLQDMTLEELVACSDRLPDQIREKVKNNAGGVYNHNLYFSLMSPASKLPQSGNLYDAIIRCFGSFDEFKKRLLATALARFGSGYAWLATFANGRLTVVSTANQDVVTAAGLCPILLVDVWEHAYYLRYQNRRAEYLENWFQVINWPAAQLNYYNCFCRRL